MTAAPFTDAVGGRGRFIPADASPFERFRIGDTVAHFSLGDGIITRNDGITIGVKYQRRYADHIAAVGGKNIEQNYDARWFENNPRLLFHRGEIAPVPEAS